MKKYILLFLLVAVGLSPDVYGQKVVMGESRQYKIKKKITPRGFNGWDPLLPRRDTVIMRGEEIEVGGKIKGEFCKSISTYDL